MTSSERDRWYDDACGAAHALDLVGERWSLLVMRELMFGPKRFGDLRSSLPGISANVLTQRLASLEASGIVLRRKLPPPAAVQVYELTQWGHESEPIFQALGRWAARSPTHDPTLPLSAASFLMSLRTMLDAERAAGVSARIGFVLGEEQFVVDLADSKLAVSRNDATATDVVVTGTPAALAGLIYAGLPLPKLESEGTLRVDGDRSVLDRFVTLFPLPAKADATR